MKAGVAFLLRQDPRVADDVLAQCDGQLGAVKGVESDREFVGHVLPFVIPLGLQWSSVRGYCAGMVISGSFSLPPVSASVKKNITAVSARFVSQSRSPIQNQCPR